MRKQRSSRGPICTNITQDVAERLAGPLHLRRAHLHRLIIPLDFTQALLLFHGKPLRRTRQARSNVHTVRNDTLVFEAQAFLAERLCHGIVVIRESVERRRTRPAYTLGWTKG